MIDSKEPTVTPTTKFYIIIKQLFGKKNIKTNI